MTKILILGMGEVGTAHANLLEKAPGLVVRGTDLIREKVPARLEMGDDFQPDVLMVAIRWSPQFVDVVRSAMEQMRPKMLHVLSTVPPGTTESLDPLATHSTTRGIHPHLEDGLTHIVKHVGGRTGKQMADIFRRAGITCRLHHRAATTEAAHILNNCAYGVNLMLADEMQKLCRKWGVDYVEAVMAYTTTHNAGFERLDHETSKMRMVLTPPNGHIGGHCVVQSAGLIPEDIRTPMMDRLAHYNDEIP